MLQDDFRTQIEGNNGAACTKLFLNEICGSMEHSKIVVLLFEWSQKHHVIYSYAEKLMVVGA
jgi:hypothetical protein